jgi:hypothetical protein
MVVAILVGAGICLVSFPNVTILIANSLGVGRGVDLVIYLALLAIGFMIALIYSKIREIEGRITLLSREIAVSRAEDGRSKP